MTTEPSLKLLPMASTSAARNKASNETKAREPSELRKRESLEQLSTNALAPYKPNLSRFENPESVKTYCCCHCGDIYISESNFEFHINRRSVLIHFNCDSCETVQVFYNRCRLLAHITAHTDKGEPSDIRKGIVSPLPRVMMEGIHNDFMKSLESEDLDDEVDQMDNELPTPAKLVEVSLYEVGEQASTTSATTEVQDIPMLIDKPVQKTIKCSECEETFDNADERKEHFINNNKLPITISDCSKCGIRCPTECSLKAHKRLHLQVSPYVCPECGDNPDRYWENFQKHLRYQCLHYSRLVSYKCPLCVTLGPSPDVLKKHLLIRHTLALIKCRVCPMAFKTSTAFFEHKKNHHGTTNIGYMMVFKCGLCDGAFLEKELIVNHMDLHLKNICQYAFKCPECSAPFLAKEILHEHMQKDHLKVYSEHVIGNVMNEVDTSEEKKLLEFNYSKIECLLCHCAFSSHQGYGLHVTRSHSYLKYPCGICGATLRLRAERIMHGKGHLRSNVPLCLLCHNKPITEPESLDAHLLYHVERIKYRTICVVCGKGLFNFQETLQHLRSEHYLRNVATADTPGTQNQEITIGEQKQCADNNVHDDASNHSPLPKMIPISNPVLEVKDKDSGSSSSKNTKYESGHCFKCTFASSDRTEFKTHILAHKPTPSCFQCMECGDSYMTVGILKLHLKMHHRILDTDKYLEVEGAHHIPEKSQESMKTNALECSVCSETFASEALLKTHLRSHGMAFIQAKKTSLA